MWPHPQASFLGRTVHYPLEGTMPTVQDTSHLAGPSLFGITACRMIGRTGSRAHDRAGGAKAGGTCADKRPQQAPCTVRRRGGTPAAGCHRRRRRKGLARARWGRRRRGGKGQVRPMGRHTQAVYGSFRLCSQPSLPLSHLLVPFPAIIERIK